jgi:Brp/Blh family beta-carotene 15,15'-monooxygenase
MSIAVEYRYIRIFFSICSIAILLAISPVLQISTDKLQIFLLMFVITIGLSHGSLDWMLAKHWGLRSTIKQGIFFGLAYMVVASISFLTWQIFPASCLIIFLMMSMLHFANDWRNELSRRMACSIGIAVISMPAVRYHHDVGIILALLVPKSEAEMITMILRFLGWISILITTPIIISKTYTNSEWWLAAEITSLILLGLIVPPLLYFIVYFCNLHALKHWISMRDLGVYQHLSKALGSACWPTLICIIIGVAIIHESSNLNFSDALIKTIFIGLAALTVPHWLLLEIYPKTSSFRRRNSPVIQ